jgi:hypothetical protein
MVGDHMGILGAVVFASGQNLLLFFKKCPTGSPLFPLGGGGGGPPLRFVRSFGRRSPAGPFVLSAGPRTRGVRSRRTGCSGNGEVAAKVRRCRESAVQKANWTARRRPSPTDHMPKDVFIDQGRRLGARKLPDTVVALTVNSVSHAD